MSRNRVRVFSLPNMIGNKQSTSIKARYFKNVLCKHCIYVDLKNTIKYYSWRTKKMERLTTTTNKKDREACRYKTQKLRKSIVRRGTVFGILKRVTESTNKTLIILHSIFHDWNKIRSRKYGDTYHINTPVEIDHRISPRTIFMVLALLARNCVST